MDITWRPYQNDCFKAIEKQKKKGTKRHLIVMATGTGKRLIAVGLSQNYKRVLFLCHREELMEQAYADFSKMYPFDVGIVKGPDFDINKRIVIGSAQTMWRRLDRIKDDHFDCVMADEAHHYLAPTYIQPLEYFKAESVYGFTATPTRLDGLNFTNIMDKISYEYPIEKAIKEGYLCPLEAYRIKTEIDISGVKKVAGDFNQKELSTKVDIPERNKLIVQKYQQYAPGRQAIVFCASIQHATNVAREFTEAGISAVSVSSKTPSDVRKMVNISYRTKRYQIITNVNILTEGWDYSDVGCVIMARPTQSVALYMQMLGRGTRLKSNEYVQEHMRKDCTILDFVDNSGNHKLVNHWTIEGTKEIKDRVLISDDQKEIYLEKIAKAREARIKARHKDDKKVHLFKLTPIKRIRHTGRLNEPATEKQLKWLRDEGVLVEGYNYTKGQASEFIMTLPAKEFQINKLIEWGYDVHRKEVKQFQYYNAKREIKERLEEQRAN